MGNRIRQRGPEGNLKEFVPRSCTYLRKMECPNMREREGDTSMTYEHYDCKVCGMHIALDYDEMR